MSIYKVLMCGDRNWWDQGPILRELEWLVEVHGKNELLIIHGGAPGADTLAGILASTMSVHVARVDALWATRYKSAGPQRNATMLALEPHKVIAFHEDISKSKGTADMVKRARKAPWNPIVRVATN